MKKILFLLLLLGCFVSVSFGTELTIQPSTIDNYIYKNAATTNYGTLTYLYVGDQNNYIRRAILSFDFSALPAGATISAATLNLYYYGYDDANQSGKTFYAERVIQRNWTEAGSTWNIYNGTNSWATAGGDYSAGDVASTTAPASAGWMQWNVLAQVQFAQSSTVDVAHFLIKNSVETSSGYAKFYSSEYATDTTKCPKLIITYTVSGWAGKFNCLTAPAKANGLASPTKINGL